MAKNNARTFRYSDEVANILKQHNNDFDALVLECFYKLPEIQKEVERNEKRVKELRNEWTELYHLTQIKYELSRIETMMKNIVIE